VRGVLVSGATRAWLAFKRLTEVGFPRRFPIVQFPSLPLIVGLASGAVAGSLAGAGHDYLMSISYLAITIWAYRELAYGVNWFRRLLGLAFVVVLVVRVAHSIG
jgi:hypothetical protein